MEWCTNGLRANNVTSACYDSYETYHLIMDKKLYIYIYALFIYLTLLGLVQGSSKVPQKSLSPATFSSFPWGSWGQMRYIMIPVCSGSLLGPPPSWMSLEVLQWEVLRRCILIRCLNHLKWLLSVRKGSCSTSRSSRILELLTQSLNLIPATHPSSIQSFFLYSSKSHE